MKTKTITIGDGLECPKCDKPMKRKESLKKVYETTGINT